MSTKIHKRFAGVQVHHVKRRSSLHSFKNNSIFNSKQNRVPIINVKPRLTVYPSDPIVASSHPVKPKAQIHSAPISSIPGVLNQSNSQPLKKSATHNTSGAGGNTSFNFASESKVDLGTKKWLTEDSKRSGSEHYNSKDWQSITATKRKEKNRRSKCMSKICCCHPCLCCFLMALSILLLLGAMTAALVVTLNQQRTTVITSTIETMTATSSTQTSVTTTTTTRTTTTVTTTTTTAQRVFLINGDAENGTLYGWTAIGSSPSIDDGTANLGSTPPHSGSYDFYGGGGQSLYQRVSLTSMFSTAQLDSGSLYASYSFWQRSANQTPPDTAQVTLVFRSASNTVLSNSTTGPSACILVWCPITGNLSLPVGTRSIDYVMHFKANFGGFADAWIDDNSLDVS